jgi:hypothetical protein
VGMSLQEIDPEGGVASLTDEVVDTLSLRTPPTGNVPLGPEGRTLMSDECCEETSC